MVQEILARKGRVTLVRRWCLVKSLGPLDAGSNDVESLGLVHQRAGF